MNQIELLQAVKIKLPTRDAVTAIFIQMRYHVLHAQAHQCITDLQAEGLIGKEWDSSLGGYPVLVKEQS